MERVIVEKTASRGIAVAPVYMYLEPELRPETAAVSETAAATEQERFERARNAVIEDLQELAATNEIFAAHLEIAGDFTLQDGVAEKIRTEQKNAELALQEKIDELAEIFSMMDDAYMKERGSDIKDVGKRMMAKLKGVKLPDLGSIQNPSIVAARDLFPSDTVKLDPELVKGIIVVDPDSGTLADYAKRQKEYEAKRKRLESMRNTPAVTKEGKRIFLCANVGGIADIKKALEMNIDGVGLFRSEFLYMENTHFPTEEEQYLVYREAAELCPSELTIRTLDIGGDKELPYYDFEKEENPFLGWRAIRISLDMRDMFKEQLRAILRASAFGHVRIMFPMMISLEELQEAKQVVEECKEELKQEQTAFDESIEMGMMMETPASVILAEDFAKEAGFFSIGTNDLTQYVLAVDRGNKKIADRYDYFHLAVVKAIGHIIRAGHKEGIKVGMCGEMAGDPRAVPVLLDMVLDEFSMSAGSIDYVREQILTR